MGIFLTEEVLETKQLQVMNEAYFGRTPGITGLFNAYADWREQYVASTKYFTVSNKNVYDDKYWFFLNKACEQFGFKSMQYCIVNSAKLNSYTIGSIVPTRTSNMIEITKEGYRFKPDTKIHACVAVYPDLIFSPKFSSEENFAVFLHEIGHNFQTAASNTICSLTAASGAFNLMYDLMTYGPIEPLITLLMTSDTVKGIDNKITNFFLSNEVMGNILVVTGMIKYIGSYVYNLVMGVINFAHKPINLIFGFLNRLLPFMINVVTGGAVKDYYGERFADGFAASYGFGESLQSALGKFEGNGISRQSIIDDSVGAIPVLSHLYALACLPGMLLWGIIDCHPNLEARAYSILKDLKTDLDDPSLSPQLKSQLKKEITEYEKSMDKYFEESKKLKNPNVVSAVLQEMIYTKCGGGTKFKISELPFKNTTGGFRGEVNSDANRIMNTKIR